MEASESPRFMGQPPTPPDGALQGFSVVKQEEEKSFNKVLPPNPWRDRTSPEEPREGSPVPTVATNPLYRETSVSGATTTS